MKHSADNSLVLFKYNAENATEGITDKTIYDVYCVICFSCGDIDIYFKNGERKGYSKGIDFDFFEINTSF